MCHPQHFLPCYVPNQIRIATLNLTQAWLPHRCRASLCLYHLSNEELGLHPLEAHEEVQGDTQEVQPQSIKLLLMKMIPETGLYARI